MESRRRFDRLVERVRRQMAETPEETEKRLRKNEAARRSRAKRREAEAAMTPDERLDRSLMKKGLTREEIDEKKRRMNEVIKWGNK